MKKIISIILAAMLLVSCFAVTAGAADKQSVSVRIEGITKTLFDGNVDVELVDDTTVKDVLTALNTENKDITITGIDDNYITDINVETAGTFGGYDGWYYQVNDKAAEVGINDCKITASDSIVLYYGGYPCQVPVADLSNAKSGIIKITSYDASYDENWNATYAWTPVVDATVTLNTKKYTTDKDGVVTFNPDDFSGKVTVQISKSDASGAPAVCRFSSNCSFELEQKNEKPNTTIKKSPNTLKVSGSTKTLKAKKLKTKKITIKKAVKVSKAKGKLTYTITKIKKNTKKITINKKGEIVVGKKLKKGTYKVTVKVTADGNDRYKKGSKKATVIIKVK